MFWPYFRPSKCFAPTCGHQHVSVPTSAHEHVSALLPPINMFRPYIRPSKCFAPTCGHQHVSVPTSAHQQARQQNIMRKNTTVNQHMDRDTSVGIATCYGLNVSGIESRCGYDFPHPATPALGLKQPPVYWVPGLFTGGKAAEEWR